MQQQITLTQAAELAGLAPKTLRDAAQRGALRTIVVNRRLRLTTKAWLKEYLDNRPERFKARSVAVNHITLVTTSGNFASGSPVKVKVMGTTA